jgi:two-component system NtrC family sensor kinase
VHGKRADNIVKSILEHSRGASGERRKVDLNALVEAALNLAYHGARAQDQNFNFNIALERDLDRGIAPIELVPQDMTRVYLNLFGNVFFAANKRGETANEGFRPALKVTTRDFGSAVEVKVRDNGCGVPSEIRNKLFQPFSPPSRPGRARASASRSAMTSSPSSTAARLPSIGRVGEFSEFTIRLQRGQELVTPWPQA